MRLKDRVAVVTGAAQGFGEGIARRFAAEGARVVIADLQSDAAARVAADIAAAHPEAAVSIGGDVSVRTDMQAIVDRAVAAYGGLDIFVNNAGTSHRGQSMLTVTEAEVDRIMAVNVKAIWHSAVTAIPAFRDRGGGVILNIASISGPRPRPGLALYAASKGAAITLTRAMAVELAPEKVRVCAINPVAGDTPLLPTFLGRDTEEARAKAVATIPLGRLATAEDIAQAALYLCSDAASLVTGACLDVDGGRGV